MIYLLVALPAEFPKEFADKSANDTWDKNVSKGYEMFLDTF